MTSKKRIKFKEGQWFAVPLRREGYAIGIVSRGSNKSVCLGYFFGPISEQPPGDENTWAKNPENSILISQFSDLGIVNGSWPLIQSTRPFQREEWPIPKFIMPIPFSDKSFLREYEFSQDENWVLLQETVVETSEINGFPKDSFLGSGLVEIRLTELLYGIEHLPK